MTYQTPAEISREESFDIGGVTLFTRTAGNGPSTIVLHGGPGAHHDYLLPQFDRLANGRTLHYYDQRGGGRSPVGRDVPIDWRTQVNDLNALIEHWDLSRVPILGYSWGGLLAMLFATEFPGLVSHLALVSPAPATRMGRTEFEIRLAERASSPHIVAAREQLRASDLREEDAQAYRQRAFELSVAGYFRELSNVRALTPFRVTGRTQQGVWESLGDYDIRDRLRQLSIPSIVLHGRYDPIPMETAAETAKLINAQLIVMEQSGHVPYVEDTEHFVSALDAFLPRGNN